MKNSDEQLLEYILFTVNREVYALEVEYFLEVLEPIEVSPLPFVPEYVDGLVNVNGDIIPQIDLSFLINKKRQEAEINDSSIDHTILIVDVSGMSIALKVGVVQEPVAINQSDLVPVNSQSKKNTKKSKSTDKKDESTGFVKHTFKSGHKDVSVLDITRLKDVIKAQDRKAGEKGFLGKLEDIKSVAEYSTEYLIAVIGGVEYAFELNEIYEINEFSTVQNLPQAPSFVEGVSLIRDEPRLIVNLSRLLDNNNSSTKKGEIILVKSGDVKCGFVVDEMVGLEDVQKANVKYDKDQKGQTILRNDGETLTKVIKVEELMSEKFKQAIRPFLHHSRDETEKVIINYVEILRFQIGGDIYGFDVKDIKRVVTDKQIEPLLNDYGYIVGTMELEGHVVPVVNLLHQLGYKDHQPRLKECIVVNDGDSDWGLAIDATDQIIQVDEQQVDKVNQRDASYISAFSRFEESLITVLNTSEICHVNKNAKAAHSK